MPKWRGRKAPENVRQQYKQKRETEVSPRLINFVLHMYKQLTLEQRYEIYLGKKRKLLVKSRVRLAVESNSKCKINQNA